MPALLIKLPTLIGLTAARSIAPGTALSAGVAEDEVLSPESAVWVSVKEHSAIGYAVIDGAESVPEMLRRMIAAPSIGR